MPTVYDPNLDEQDPNKRREMNLAGDSGSIGGGQSTAPQQPANRGSGSFVNLQSYLNANKGNSEQMATGIGSRLGGEANTAKGQLDNTSNVFNDEVQKNTFKADEGLLGRFRQDAGKLSGNDLSTLQRGYNATYGGPSAADFASQAAGAKSAVDKANTRIGMTAQAPGRSTLLQEQYAANDPRYSGGLSRLDGFLVGADSGAKSKLQGLRDEFKGLSGLYDTAAGRAQGAVDSARTATDQSRSQIQATAADVRNNTQADLANRVAQLNAQRNQMYQEILATAQDPTQKGFIKEGRKATAEDLVNDTDLARFNALNAIAGNTYAPVYQKSTTPLGDAYTYNKNDYETYLAREEAARRGMTDPYARGDSFESLFSGKKDTDSTLDKLGDEFVRNPTMDPVNAVDRSNTKTGVTKAAGQVVGGKAVSKVQNTANKVNNKTKVRIF
jgi:hypothetical protein